MAGPGNILIRVGAEAGQAVSELTKVNRSLGDTMTTSEKMHAGLKKAALPAAAALGVLAVAGADAAKAALEDAAAQDKLRGQLERVAGATDAQVKAAEDYITKLEMQTGIADDDLRPALGKLATATGDVTKAQDALALAVDVSAATGKDLNVVSTALAKGYGGNTAALGRLVPGLDKATLATKDMHKITDELARLTGGAATDAAKTSAGQMKVLAVQSQELKETLGASLIPVIQALLPVLQAVAKFAADNTTAIKLLVAVVAALAAGILVANAALKAYEAAAIVVKVATAAWTAVQWLLNAALDANPIGLVVIALGALGAALVLAYKHSQTFRDVVGASLDAVHGVVSDVHRAFSALEAAASDAFDWIVAHWKLALFAFGPIGAAVYLISENFDRVKAAAKAAADLVEAAWQLGRFGFQAIANNVAKIARAFGKIEDAVRAAIDAVEKLLGWLGKIHVPHIDLPGPFTAPAVAGAPALAARGLAPAAAAGGTTINVYGAVDPEGTARAIRRVLDAHDRRQGRTI